MKEHLDEEDMVRAFRIMDGDDKLDKKTFWTMEGARQGAGRQRFKEKEIRRTVDVQRSDVRKRSFASKIQDSWSDLCDSVKQAKNPRAFRRSYRKVKNIV